MDKRGTDKLISVYWFVILFLVAAGIVYMVIVFYGAPYDVRESEANIMINQIADCFAAGGKLKNSVNYFNELNLLSECKLNFNVEDTNKWKNDQFYVGVNYYSFEKDKGVFSDILRTINLGNSLLNDNCGLEGKYTPVCVERSFYVLEGDSPRIIKIKSVVGKVEKNAQ